MNILLYDDEPIVLEELCELVAAETTEADCFSFTDAEKALDFAEHKHIDLAFLNIDPQTGDGVSMAKSLQILYPKLNIIFCADSPAFMPEAFELYASAYLLKPVTKEKLSGAMSHLRYPPEEGPEALLTVHCFGFFEVFSNGVPLRFKRKKTKELLAYLIDRRGAEVNAYELCSVLWENETDEEKNMAYLRQLFLDLRRTLKDVGAEAIQISNGKGHALDTTLLDCDYYRFLEGNRKAIRSFAGEYMLQYSWAESTCAALMTSV